MNKSQNSSQAYKKIPASSLKISYKIFFSSLEGIDIKPFISCQNEELEIVSLAQEKTLPKHFPKISIRAKYKDQILTLRVSPEYLFLMYV